MRQTSHNSPLSTFSPAAFFDIWKVGVMSFELWTTSLATIAMRNQLWCTQAPHSANMIKENQRMVTEKLEASMEIGLALQKAMFNMAAGTYAPWWVTSRSALLPLHRRTMANSRRLSRRR
ncbi:hypothetical protein MHM84_17445 [Halomonas sp. McH1-25]|uniref:hypothetical protein n=1 Tax=unclassified Halomonas TaxID=2609666 RepID=UPI001EF4CBE6|nr:MULTISPECIES: hypothetical protein [unclassified Halomonas]MCG7601554.1 hypothetical protein [Halomonas sp. McH1-25]MCP1343352.1 hypothetical protein [Halomonas sp. FL8]MCP1362617.1 hypothetical protein [Halomonas sp. BBD45]MCP1367138.1 hypothetical protein [Halomonas sp. BBD48]